MTTPLQKAAQAVLKDWDSPDYLEDSIEQLRKALVDEITQAVEPVGHFLDCGNPQGWCEVHDDYKDDADVVPLYLHPPQPQATTPVSTCGLDTDTLRDMAGAAFEEAMAFGVSTDSFERLARHVNKAATKAAKGEKP